jgi:hypothetical protein
LAYIAGLHCCKYAALALLMQIFIFFVRDLGYWQHGRNAGQNFRELPRFSADYPSRGTLSAG